MAANKSFWQRPEGVTGALVGGGLLVGTAFFLQKNLPAVVSALRSPVATAATLVALTGVVYMALDPKARNLVWYAYKSLMRWVTGIFVQIDPMSVLRSYIEDLEKNLRNLSKQIGALRGQMRQLRGTMEGNQADIEKNMRLAERAKSGDDDRNLALSARKAARLQEANAKYAVLMQRMDVLYRLLNKMYENSEIMLEDTRDQVQIREQEYRAIQSSHSAIRSAMNIIKGDPDQRALFDQATEALANEVSQKVGEMERFMDTSRNLMATIDLQNGVLADDGLQMLEEWERQSPLLGTQPSKPTERPLDLNAPRPEPLRRDDNEYTNLFE
jgi:phage shock protein A